MASISERLGRYATMSIAEIDKIEAAAIPFVFKGTMPEEYWMGTDQLAKVIDYGVNLVGEDHIALGSDFDGGPPLPREIKDISNYGEMREGAGASWLFRAAHPQDHGVELASADWRGHGQVARLLLTLEQRPRTEQTPWIEPVLHRAHRGDLFRCTARRVARVCACLNRVRR